jgi:peptidoglycan/xylan/chitin deacetylase (PgdA/CDA1 family)
MKKVSGIKFLFFSRGISKWVRRLVTVHRRFSFLPHKQMNIIRQYADCLKAHEIRGTFFIPAILLERYVTHLRTIDPKTVEWGIHGFVHTDHSQLEYEQQKTQITKAVDIFDRYDFKFKGFRCPYLRFNEHTKKALMATGRFQFDSSNSVVWEEVYGPGEKYYPWIKDFYKADPYKKDLASPYAIGQLTEIPVSLPDDDITVDRERLGPAEIFNMWSVMLKTCHQNKEVFVLQLHPERFFELREVLNRLIEEAKSLRPAIWITTLSEVAHWQKNNQPATWPASYQGAFCITGDIDAITINDFFTRLREW